MPNEQRLMDHLFIKVDGSDLPTEVMDDLIEVTVDSSLHLPDMFTIHLHDEGLKRIDEGPLKLGAEVEISAQPEEGGSSQVLFKGEITASEPNFGEGASATLLVRGYDRSHRLHRGTNAQAYQQVTDSDLANRIAQQAGLRAQVDSTNEVHEHVFQHNQTHMEFLAERAQRIGYEFFVEDKTLYFRKPPQNGDALELEWGRQLRSFRPRQTLVEQVDEVVVKGWNAKDRQVITGQATRGAAEPQIGEQQSGAQLASQAFSNARRLVADEDVKSQAEADTLAQAFLDELSGAYIEAEGLCYGQPALRAGKRIKLTSLGTRFSGTYLVTSATHIYSAAGGYNTSFTVHGRRPESLYTLLSEPAGERANGRHPGPVVAVVTNINDPEGRGRVRVKFPWMSDDVESDWARLMGVGAGKGRGLFCLPEVNDEVLVAFERGDFNRPYVLGGLWNGQDKPPIEIGQAVQNGETHKRGFKTRVGHTLTFVDGQEAGVILETAGGHRLTLADEGKKVMLETSGGHVLTLDDGGSEVKLESSANLTIKSGANLTIEAGAVLELKGASFKLNGDGMGEVKAGGTLQVQGALVKIN